MPQTGHKTWLYLATASDFLTVTELEVQTGLSWNRQAERIDASHKNSDTKVFLPGSNEETIDIACRFEFGSGTDPRDRVTEHETLLAAFRAGTTVYLEARGAPTKGATLATADRFERAEAVLLSYNEDWPDEDVCNVTMQAAVNSLPAL